MNLDVPALQILGVRHHSPACARLVRHVILKTRPRHVLIEGPCDMNGRLGELALPHELPIALFSYLRRGEERRAAWSPFCEYSPEWVALDAARKVGAEARFCDLPSWHDVFGDFQNRYADRRGGATRELADAYIQVLCDRFNLDDMDALWDHLFEQPAPLEDLRVRLEAYFERLRGDAPASFEDQPREDFMARSIRWALRTESGGVVVVCGGYHAPALARAAQLDEDGDHQGEVLFPDIPPPKDATCGSYLVPYSYPRLDAFAGYQSGMPSPAFYEALWNEGPEAASERTLERVAVHLRGKNQPVSTADLISASSLARGLAHLRGHDVPARTDLLDAIAGALVKDGLEVPMPWSRRGPLLPRTDPLLAQVVAALSGERRGRLAVETPRPPLVADVRAELQRVSLELPARSGRRAPSRDVRLRLTSSEDLDRSRVLHRLRLLGIPGFERLSGPAWGTDPELAESWRLIDHEDADAALVEASGWGAMLESAAAARLESQLSKAESLSELARVMGEAAFVGLSGLAQRVMDLASVRVAGEPSFAELGAATRRWLDLWRHDDLFGAAGSQTLATVLAACHDRGLWLLEGLGGAGLGGGQRPADRSHLEALAAIRDLTRTSLVSSGSSRGRAESVFERRTVDSAAPPAIRGGCLGSLWSLGHWNSDPEASAHAVRALLGAAEPDTLGDFLAGLFALAREEALDCDPLLVAMDKVIVGLDQEAFLRALPALRLAFSYYPPLERELLARLAVDKHSEFERSQLRLPFAPEDIARGAELDARASALASRYGLSDRLDEADP